MELIEQNVREIIQEPEIDGMLRHIDYCAGICYDRHGYTKDSYKFVKTLFERGHMRPLEFGTVNLEHTYEYEEDFVSIMMSPYSYVDLDEECLKVTTNFRVVCEVFGDFDKAIEYIGMYRTEEQFFKRRTFAWVCSRAIADEFRTHTTLSSLMKSTRYVDESKDEIEIAKPYWFDENPDMGDTMMELFNQTEETYKVLRENGLKPQDAREVLPLSLATEIYQCGVWGVENTGWERFIKMRNADDAHPDAANLCRMMMEIEEQ